MHATTSPAVPWVIDDGGRVVGRRVPGAIAGAVIALGPAVVSQVVFASPLLLLGVPAAAVSGAIVAPSVRERSIGTAVMAMAPLTIVVAEAFLLAPGLAASLIAPSSLAPDALAGLVIGGLLIAFVGLIIVGAPMMLVTIPCAFVWALAVRRLGGPSPHRAVIAGAR